LNFWRAEGERRRVGRPLEAEAFNLVKGLLEEHLRVEPVLTALQGDPGLSEELRIAAIRLARTAGDLSSSQLNGRAWMCVNPDREDKDTDVALGLRMTRVAIELSPEDSALRDTHAWALFANGFFDEALVESAKALELATLERKGDYQGHLDRMRAMVKEVRSDHPNTLKAKQSLEALLKEKQASESPPPDPPSDGTDGDQP
jgi:hypothetical protein